MPGKRVLILVENLSVPLDRRVWQESLALTRAGYEVVVVCPLGDGYDMEPYIRLDGIEIHRYALRGASSSLGYLREYLTAVWRMLRIARAARPFDVVQACNPPDLLFLVGIPFKLGGAKFIYDQHDLIPELYLSRFGRGKNLVYRTLLLFERCTYRLADVVISTNDSYREKALERGAKAEGRVFVVRSTPALDRFRPLPPAPALKEGKAHLLAYLGVMGPQDGIDYALRALAHLRDWRQDWRAVFIGSGDEIEPMLGLRAELGLDELVTFTGRLPDEDVRRYLSTADVCLAPDPLNPLNDVSTMNKIVEYMAIGRPLVSFDLREARVSAGEAALYAPPNDERAFAALIGQLLDDPAERERRGRIGRERVEQELAWEHSERALLEAYETALGPQP
ncbi:MAG TPA: glycosyltransferase family 4 protein [Gaiellaceae bacterium]